MMETKVNKLFDIEEAKNCSFDELELNPFNTRPYVGSPHFFQNSEIENSGGKAHYIRGDGSCWARSLWQSVFSQIYSDESKFNRFIHTIANPKAEYALNSQLAKHTIYILFQLLYKTFEQRINYLNITKVDDTLIFYMRDIAGEQYFIDTKDSATAKDIKTNKHRYGANEATAFLRYFDLETHNVRVNYKGEFWYDYQPAFKNTQRTKLHELDTLPHSAIYPVNDKHYEFISSKDQRETIPAILFLKAHFELLKEPEAMDQEQICQAILLKLQAIYLKINFDLGYFDGKKTKDHDVHKGIESIDEAIEFAHKNIITWNNAFMQTSAIVTKYSERYSRILRLKFYDQPSDSVKCFYDLMKTIFDSLESHNLAVDYPGRTTTKTYG